MHGQDLLLFSADKSNADDPYRDSSSDVNVAGLTSHGDALIGWPDCYCFEVVQAAGRVGNRRDDRNVVDVGVGLVPVIDRHRLIRICFE